MTHDRAPGVTILHISDTQFGQHHRFTDDDSLSSSLIRDLELLAADGIPSVDLVMLSGDIAETGRRREYEQARAFVDAVLEHTALPPDRLVLVPGNHDVSWSLCQAYFNECDDEQVEPREPYPKKWRNYRDFVVDLHGPTGFTEEQPYRVHRFPELRVVVAGLNSTIQESHQDQDHFGWCGTSQLRWFAEQLREGVDSLRVGVVHHNVRRKADADNENLRDEDDLTRILGPQLDLLLHGHTHEGKQDRLSDGTPVLATGSAAVTSDWRPGEVPNQYQIIQVTPGSLTRWTRQWAPERKEWIGDLRASAAGDAWTVKQGLNTPGWQQTTPTAPEPKHAREWRDLLVDGQVRFGRLEEDFTNQVERVTRFQFDEATIDRRRKAPDLQYLLVATPNAPLRCVAVVDGQLDADLLRRFESEVFDPLRSRQGEFVVVHHGSDDPRLRVDAARRGIRVKTWLEYNNLLELSAYRTWLMADLEQDSLYPQALYQPQRFHGIDRFGRLSGSERDDLLGEVYDAILEEDGRFLLVLGDAGFGKSFLVRRLAKEMLDNERVNITPIVIYLRDRDKQQTLDEMVASVLIPSRASFHADRFRHSLQNGTLALLVDGYDEFAVRVGYESAASQLRTFVDAMQGRAKLLLTTRPSHFRSTDEVTTKLFASLHTVHDGRVHQLQPFNEPQQQAFLTRWFELRDEQDPPARANEWMRALAEVDNLPELARTPRMLSFMVQDLELATIRAATGHGPVTAAELYQRLVTRWLGEEVRKIDDGDRRAVTPEDRQLLLEDLALELWRIGERDVGEDLLQRVARQSLDLPGLDLTVDQAAQLVGGRTLLRVDGNRWRFAHQSVWEFLLANRLARALQAGEDDARLGEAELTSLTARFLRDLAPAETLAWVTRVTGAES